MFSGRQRTGLRERSRDVSSIRGRRRGPMSLRAVAGAVALAILGSALALAPGRARAEIGDLSPTGAADLQRQSGTTAVDPSSGYIYVGFNGFENPSDNIHVYRRVGGSLELAGGGRAGAVGSTVKQIEASGGFVYAVTSKGIWVYGQLNPPRLPFVGCYNRDGASGCTKIPGLTDDIRQIALAPSDPNVYVLSGRDYLVTLRRDGGSLLPVDCLSDSPAFGCTETTGDVFHEGGYFDLAVSNDGSAVFAGYEKGFDTFRRAGNVLRYSGCLKDIDVNNPEDLPPCRTGRGVRTDFSGGGIVVGPTDPSGRYDPVYTKNDFTGKLALSYYDRTTGELFFSECYSKAQNGQPLPGCAFAVQRLGDPEKLALSPDGRSLYVTTGYGQSLVIFGLAPGRPYGTLASRGCFVDQSVGGTTCQTRPGWYYTLAVAATTTDVYVTASRDSSTGPRSLDSFYREVGPGCGVACQGPPPAPSDEPTPSPTPGPGGDISAPETTIDSAPKPKTRSSKATFTFSSNEAGTFECSLDGGDPQSCSSPHTYTGIAKGTHSFAVTAIDADGNRDASPATAGWKVKRRRR
jgi:hypothetical protein